MIIRIAIIAFIVYLLWSLLKLVLRARTIMQALKANHQHGANINNAMVKCAQCQLFVIDRDAVRHKGEYFCSLAHAQDFHS
jgi:hypothetical protein